MWQPVLVAARGCARFPRARGAVPPVAEGICRVPVALGRAASSAAEVGGGAGKAPPRWRRAQALDLRRQELKSKGAPGLPARPEVSPRRKTNRRGNRRPKSHQHATDLEDLDRRRATASGEGGEEGAELVTSSSLLVPRLQEDRVQRLLRRPVAALPRSPQFFIRFGAPMTAEDLSRDAPSVLVESRKLIDTVLERRQASQAAPDYVEPDTPFWRVPPKLRKKKVVKWQDEPTPSSSSTAAARPEHPGSEPPSDTAEAAERLKGIADLSKASKQWQAASLAPSRIAPSVLRDAHDDDSSGSQFRPSDEHTAEPSSEGSEEGKAPGFGADAPQDQREKPAQRKSAAAHSKDPAVNLVAALRERAAEFQRTGVDPDIKASLEEALRHHPGTERAARLREMKDCAKDFEQLVLEGRASVANCNELIRAQAIQGRLDAAMETHDAMKLHGFAPDSETFVSLLVGAARVRDADLARRLFLKMREQLISPTPKVYSALIKAHVRSGDLATGFGLLRKMEDERLQTDVVVHTVLIDGLVKNGQLTKAWEEFHSMRTWKLVKPDEVLFTVMIKACAQAQEAERALNILDDLRTCGLYPTDLTYGELIHAMASSPYHAGKALDFFRQMKAEDLPLSPFIFEKMLQACKSMGDAKRAREIVQEMQSLGMPMQLSMYCELVGLFATAMRRPKTREYERLQNLRCAWQVVSEARGQCKTGADWTRLLNEAMGVYIAGGFSQYAVDLLQQYALFGARPDAATYRQLLELLGRDLKDVGRFFALWEALPRQPKPPDDLYHLALEMAMETRSAKRTCAVLEELYAAHVFPSPQLADRLAKVGRNVLQIHHLVGKFVSLNRDLRVAATRRETALLQAHMDERELILATEGKTVRTPTPEQEARERHFEKLKKRGWFRKPWLPKAEYIASKRKGGEEYAKRHDRPRPNLLGA